MWRRLNREDLEGSNPLLLEGDYDHGQFRWQVYEDYEIVTSEDGNPDHIQAARSYGSSEPQVASIYQPLTDTPYLFLDFARIVERKDPGQTLLNWFEKYGVLGLTKSNPQYTEALAGESALRDEIFPGRSHDDRGGPGDYVGLIWSLAYEANDYLTVYEAALGCDKKKLEQALFGAYEAEHAESRRLALERKAEKTGEDLLDVLVHSALWQILEYAAGGLQFVYPDIVYPLGSKTLLVPNQLNKGWRPRNLWGAMSLQFYWLITSADSLSHCRHCGRIISHAPPIFDEVSRKPRNDKEFCNSRCRQNHHYHARIKPGRQSDKT